MISFRCRPRVVDIRMREEARLQKRASFFCAVARNRRVRAPRSTAVALVYIRFVAALDAAPTGSQVSGVQFVINNDLSNNNNNLMPGFGILAGGASVTNGSNTNQFFAATNSTGLTGTPSLQFGGTINTGANLLVARMNSSEMWQSAGNALHRGTSGGQVAVAYDLCHPAWVGQTVPATVTNPVTGATITVAAKFVGMDLNAAVSMALRENGDNLIASGGSGYLGFPGQTYLHPANPLSRCDRADQAALLLQRDQPPRPRTDLQCDRPAPRFQRRPPEPAARGHRSAGLRAHPTGVPRWHQMDVPPLLRGPR